MSYLIMRNRITGQVYTKDNVSVDNKVNKDKAYRYNLLFGHSYDFWIDDFTDPFIDTEYLLQLNNTYDYVSYTKLTGIREEVDKYSNLIHKISYPQWYLYPLRDNLEINIVAEKQKYLKEDCEKNNMDILRILWFRHYCQGYYDLV